MEIKKSSQLAKEGGAAAGGTAAQIAAGSLLGPVGAAVAAVVGAHAGKKAGSAVKTKKKLVAAEVRPECAGAAQQAPEQQATAQPQQPVEGQPNTQSVQGAEQPSQS